MRDDIGVITLDNPPENYLADPDFIPLEILRKWTSADSLKGIIIHGAGKHFSAGGNLENLFAMIHGKEDLMARMKAGKAVLDYLENLNIPVIAAIQGVCFGGGLEIALAAHIRICSENALFAFPEINHGIIPGLGGTVRSAQQIGHRKSLNFIMAGDMINAGEALAMDLVDYVVPKSKLLDFTYTMMQKMTQDRPLPVIHAVMEALRNAKTLPINEAMQEETRLFCELALAESSRKNEP